MSFIPLRDAIALTGHPSITALDRWIRRFNRRHPEALIRRRFGAVCREDLGAALEIEAQRYTPNAAAAEALRP